MRTPMFSILIVSLNPGGKLVDTMRSVISQNYRDYEVVVKDGGSRDGSLEALRTWLDGQDGRERVRILEQPDTGIYEGMNQAAREARGEYLYFLNCGDAFASDQALARAAAEIRGCLGRADCELGSARTPGASQEADRGTSRARTPGASQEADRGTSRARTPEVSQETDRGTSRDQTPEASQETDRGTSRARTPGESHDPAPDDGPRIFYGDIYDALRGQVVASNPHMDDFACYRNVPCHQACIYHHSLFAERGYEPIYRVRADYEHFLWCFFREHARPRYIPVTLASYEGGGFSETPENRKRSAREHREITALYMSRGQRLRYRLILLTTLAPLRTRMAESPVWSGFYNTCKKRIYRRE